VIARRLLSFLSLAFLAALPAVSVMAHQGGGPAQAAPAPKPQATPTAAAPSNQVTLDEARERAEEEGYRYASESQWAEYMKVFKMQKSMVNVIGEKRARLTHLMNDTFEIVGEEDGFYLLRNLPPEDPQSSLHGLWVAAQYQQVLGTMHEEGLANKFIIADKTDVLPPFTDQVRFERRDEGLPQSGKWQMSFDVADMNGDGRPDIVLTPQRTGSPFPTVVLQQADGSWQRWSAVKWPTQDQMKMNYGSVRVADFDRDGNLDIAIACHFGSAYVLYGNGKGDFTRFVKLPQANPSITSRSLAVADFDGDGRPDIALLAEVDLDLATNTKVSKGLVSVLLNKREGWKVVSIGFPPAICGDALAAGDIDGDGATDLLLTTLRQGVRDLVWRNLGGGQKWQAVANLQMPLSAFVFTNAPGRFDRFKQADLVTCFEQPNPRELEQPVAQACVIYRFHDAEGKPTLTPTIEPIFKYNKPFDYVAAVAVGDINGDGRDDVAMAFTKGYVRVFLQFADGHFYEQRPIGIDLGGAKPFDIKIADLYHDGRGEIIVMGVDTPKGPGGVWVFVPRPVGAPGKPTKQGS